MSNSSNTVTKILFILVSAMTLAVIANNFFTFYYQKGYDFIVEAECDPSQQVCFIRDCSEGSECPPNELEQYRMFALNASDFEACANNSCINECATGSIQCEEIFCDESEGEVCATTLTEE